MSLRRTACEARDEPVRLTRIYTRGGDQGETSLGDGSRVSKLDCRIGAFGTVDELNSALGLVLAGDVPDEMREPLDADPERALRRRRRPLGAVGRHRPAAGRAADDRRLEQLCDEFNADLPELRSFVLPGGTEASARLHVARTICRRAERDVLLGAQEVELNPLVLGYLNRLSDLLFILARAANAAAGRGAPVEAWELALALAGSFVAGYVGSMLGLVLGTLRLPLIVALTGSPLAAAGTNIAISAASAGAGAIRHARERRVDWRVVAWMAPPSVAGAILGALLADDVSERLLYAAIAAVLVWSGIDLALRPVHAAHARAAAALARRRRRLRHRRARRRRRRHPRHAADAGARPRRRHGRQARGGDEPRRRLPARRRRLRDARGRARRRLADPARGAGGRDPGRLARREGDRDGSTRTRCGWRSAPCSSSSASRSPCRPRSRS